MGCKMSFEEISNFTSGKFHYANLVGMVPDDIVCQVEVLTIHYGNGGIQPRC